MLVSFLPPQCLVPVSVDHINLSREQGTTSCRTAVQASGRFATSCLTCRQPTDRDSAWAEPRLIVSFAHWIETECVVSDAIDIVIALMPYD